MLYVTTWWTSIFWCCADGIWWRQINKKEKKQHTNCIQKLSGTLRISHHDDGLMARTSTPHPITHTYTHSYTYSHNIQFQVWVSRAADIFIQWAKSAKETDGMGRRRSARRKGDGGLYGLGCAWTEYVCAEDIYVCMALLSCWWWLRDIFPLTLCVFIFFGHWFTRIISTTTARNTSSAVYRTLRPP